MNWFVVDCDEFENNFVGEIGKDFFFFVEVIILSNKCEGCDGFFFFYIVILFMFFILKCYIDDIEVSD